jgi:hypothetical protein
LRLLKHKPPVRTAHNLDLDRARLRKANWRSLVVSWENRNLFDDAIEHFLQKHATYLHMNESDPFRAALILRDPYNHFASLCRSGRGGGHAVFRYRLLWKQYANEVLGRTRFLPEGTVPILYNEWTLSAEYRRKTAKRLQIDASGEAYARTPGYGGGSSFHGVVEGVPDGLHERWRDLADDETYRSMFDEEIAILAKEIFGIACPFSMK